MKKFIFIFFLLIISIVHAQDEDFEMITDRPDETEAPSLVPKGFLQIETGFSYEKHKNDGVEERLFTYNTTLLRYGLLENLELRFGSDFLEKKIKYGTITEEQMGFLPIMIGAKIGIADETGWLPEIGFMGHLILPFTISNDFESNTTGVDFRFAFSHTLSSNADLSYNVGAKWHEQDMGAVYQYTIAYGYNLNDRWGVYVELYGDLPEKSIAEHSWDAGFTYLPKNNLQFDLLFGSGIGNEQEYMIGGGISFRLPK